MKTHLENNLSLRGDSYFGSFKCDYVCVFQGSWTQDSGLPPKPTYTEMLRPQTSPSTDRLAALSAGHLRSRLLSLCSSLSGVWGHILSGCQGCLREELMVPRFRGMLTQFCTGPSRWGLLDLPQWFALLIPSGSHELVMYLETCSMKLKDKEEKGKANHRKVWLPGWT